jgi:hypothetical protein
MFDEKGIQMEGIVQAVNTEFLPDFPNYPPQSVYHAH